MGDGRQLVLPNTQLQLKYRNGIRTTEIYDPDFEMDPLLLYLDMNRNSSQQYDREQRGLGKQQDNIWHTSSVQNEKDDPAVP